MKYMPNPVFKYTSKTYFKSRSCSKMWCAVLLHLYNPHGLPYNV